MEFVVEDGKEFLMTAKTDFLNRRSICDSAPLGNIKVLDRYLREEEMAAGRKPSSEGIFDYFCDAYLLRRVIGRRDPRGTSIFSDALKRGEKCMSRIDWNKFSQLRNLARVRFEMIAGLLDRMKQHPRREDECIEGHWIDSCTYKLDVCRNKSLLSCSRRFCSEVFNCTKFKKVGHTYSKKELNNFVDSKCKEAEKTTLGRKGEKGIL